MPAHQRPQPREYRMVDGGRRHRASIVAQPSSRRGRVTTSSERCLPPLPRFARSGSKQRPENGGVNRGGYRLSRERAGVIVGRPIVRWCQSGSGWFAARSRSSLALFGGERRSSTLVGGKGSALTKAGPRPDVPPRPMVNLAHGNPTTAHPECLCGRCHLPLYSGQPMAVDDCTARELRGCGRICRPEESCSMSIGSALHVGCAVLRGNGEL